MRDTCKHVDTTRCGFSQHVILQVEATGHAQLVLANSMRLLEGHISSLPTFTNGLYNAVDHQAHLFLECCTGCNKDCLQVFMAVLIPRQPGREQPEHQYSGLASATAAQQEYACRGPGHHLNDVHLGLGHPAAGIAVHSIIIGQ